MDAFGEMIKKKRRIQAIRTAVLCVVIPLILALAAYVFIFHINQFHLEVIMQGPTDVTLEYGEAFEEPGAMGRFYGSLLMKEGREVPVVIQGQVDDQKLGTYQLRYTSAFKKWSGSEERTVHVVDTIAPQIMLNSRPGTYVIPGLAYAEEGFAARDNYDGDLTSQVVRTETKNQVLYYVEDSSGNSAQVTRDIVYYDPIHPQLELEGEETITLEYGAKYKEPGYTASDNCDGDLTEKVQVSGSVNSQKSGTYTITYSVEDSYGNTASATRTVKVKAKPQPKPQTQTSNGSGSSSAKQPATVTPSGKVIYLTFDDGPGKYTQKLLDVLKKYNVKATFFVVKTGYTGLLDDIAADGHSIGIHSTSHDYDKVYASEEAYFKDLYNMQSIIEQKTGITTTLVRFPGGSSNTVSKFNPGIMTRLTDALTENGFQYFDWNVNSGDADGTKKTDKVVENVISGIKQHRVSIVLQHDIKSYSVDAVEKIIIWGLENGYTFLPLEPSSPTAHHGVNN